MQLKFLLAGALLPLGLMANPTPEAAAVPEAVGDAGESLSARAFSRPQHCSIVGGSSTVNCRTGPSTNYRVKMTMRKGNTYDFWCVYSGQCVTINGFRNWYVYQ
jgi:SH3-like domain-containing protein